MADPRRVRLGDLAAALGATLEGDPERLVSGVAPLDTAGPDDVSFLVDARYGEIASASRAGALLVSLDAPPLSAPTLRTLSPRRALIELLTLFYPRDAVAPGVHSLAVVSGEARVDSTASIGPLAMVETGAVVGAGVRVDALAYVGRGVEIGDGSVLYPHAVLREGVRLGRRVIVHAGAVIGSDGFGYVFDGGVHHKIPQVGSVVVEDDVEIGANATIDRATLGVTRIGAGTKIDNLVQVGHNVTIGEHCVLVAQVGVSGSSRIGRGVMLGGQVGVADHVTVGDGARVAAQSGVHAELAAGGTYLGSPARPAMEGKRIVMAEARLPELLRRVRDLERRLAVLEGRSDGGDGG